MKSTVVMLMLLGCDCDGTACEYIRTVSTDWPSVESCRSAMENQTVAADAALYPLVVAHCLVDSRDTTVNRAAASETTSPPQVKNEQAEDTATDRGRKGWADSIRGIGHLIVSRSLVSIRSVASAPQILFERG